MKRQIIQVMAAVSCFATSISCTDQTSNISSTEQQFVSSAPAFLSEIGFDEQFEQLVLPLWNEAERSYIVGQRDKNLFYVKYSHPSPKAAVLLVTGFSENTLKYRELAYNFYQRGFTVYNFDHRGHGFSDRMTRDPEVVYVERWEEYVRDLRTIITDLIAYDNLPIFVFAHSMGGAVTADLLQKEPNIIQAAVLSAPLLELNTSPYPSWIAKAVAGLGTFFWQGEQYAPGQGPVSPENWLLDGSGTSSSARFERYKADTLAAEIAQSGASFNWIKEVITANDRMKLAHNARRAVTPLRVYQAGRDTYVRPGGQNRFCDLAPNCELFIKETSKHEIYNEVNDIRTPYILEVFDFFESFLN